jgi:hypothetical protein
VTQELINGDQGFVFQPVHFEDVFVEWRPREFGGGFVAVRDTNSEIVKAAEVACGTGRDSKLFTSNGNELIQTNYAYGLILDKEGKETCGFTVISFTSTKLKVFRKWKTALFMIKGRPGLFKHRAVITTVKEKNDKGSFYNFHIAPLLENNWLKSMLKVEDEAQNSLVKEGYEFRQMVVSGMARAMFESQDTTGYAGNGTSDYVPF